MGPHHGQLSLSDVEGQAKRKQTRREKCLAQMDERLPWKELERPIARDDSKSLRGRLKANEKNKSTTP